MSKNSRKRVPPGEGPKSRKNDKIQDFRGLESKSLKKVYYSCNKLYINILYIKEL